MKLIRLLLTFLVLTSLAHAVCGPPFYTCSSTSTATVQTPAAIFSSSDAVGTVKYDTSLNASGLNPYIRATDASTLSNKSLFTSTSGGDNDEMWNCTGRTDRGAACQNATKYMFGVVNGGGTYMQGFDPSNNTFTNTTTAIPGGGPFSFSHTDPNIAYSYSVAAHAIIKTTYTSLNPTTGTQSTFYDLWNCTAVTQPFTPTYVGEMSITADDTMFELTASTAGGQGTGFYMIVYKVGSGCTVYNTSTGAVTAEWGSTGTVTSSCRYNIHGGYIFRDGNWTQLSQSAPVTGTCGNTDEFWQVGTLNVSDMCTANCAGHDTVKYSSMGVLVNGAPALWWNWIPGSGGTNYNSNPGTGVSNLANHFGSQGMDASDTYPIIASATNDSAGASNCPPGSGGTNLSAMCGEIYGVPADGSAIIRFGHNFTTPGGSGGGGSTYFTVNSAIGVESQDGKYWSQNSDMLGNLGTDNLGNNRGDIFLVKLDGGAAPGSSSPMQMTGRGSVSGKIVIR